MYNYKTIMEQNRTGQKTLQQQPYPHPLHPLSSLFQVAIKAPNSEDSSYVNKKGFHSIGCQLVCDARGLLLSAETHWPGGLKDTEILERSQVYKTLEGTEEGWLLGEARITQTEVRDIMEKCPHTQKKI